MASRFQNDIRNLREVTSLLWTEASRFVKVHLTIVLLFVIATSILSALAPVALKLVVDGFAGQTTGTSISPLLLVVFYALSQWVARAVGAIRGLLYARAEQRMVRTLSERLFAHLLRLPLRFHLNRRTGAVSQTLQDGLQGYERILHHLVFTVLPAIAELATIIAILSNLNRPVFLMLFSGALVCYTAAFAHAVKATSRAARAASAAHIDASATITDGLMNYEAIKYFTAESAIQEKVSRVLSRTENEWVGFHKRHAISGLGVGTIFATFLALTLLYAARAVSEGHMTIGDFVLINAYMLQVARPVEMLGYATQGLSEGIAMLEKILALFREKPESLQNGVSVPAGSPAELEFESVSLSYHSDRNVLRDVSFKVRAGTTVGVVGASGAGKSTIVRLLARLLDPDAGRILIDGVPVSEIALPELRRSIAVVPQDTILLNETIGDNIAFGKPHSTREEVEQAAKHAHLHEFIMSLPEQYDTTVGERGVKLSGGERQRVSIARAAIKRPQIYVFDEATSSLDSQTEREILRNLQEISRFSTTLVIAHRLSTVVQADEIVVLEAGTIVERGTHGALLNQNGRYAALWKAQQEGAAAA